ncbi:MAG TPA: hypothetical protein VLY46_01790 [Usitatibacter sp.]|nr:hypothetical protein [Usitatibacter sp.]
MSRALVLARLAAAAFAAASAACALAAPGVAIVVADGVALRASPRDSAKPLAPLWKGDPLEVRGERRDYLEVYDARLERGGFVRARLVRRVALDASAASGLLTVLRFLRDAPGTESLAVAYAAAYIQAAPAESIRGSDGAEALEALGAASQRLAELASSGAARSASAQAALAAHLEIAAHYGVGFETVQRDEDHVVVCYDGDAFRRLLDLGRASPEQAARAVLALTRADCAPGSLEPTRKRAEDEARAALLDRVAPEALPAYLGNRVHMRRAAVWSGIAFDRARRGEPAQAAAERALDELARVERGELTDADRAAYADAAMRVNASRWAALPVPPDAAGEAAPADGPRLITVAGAPGETCLLLVAGKRDAADPLVKRCTWGLVWRASTRVNREGTALEVAVQHTESWRELWVFRKAHGRWDLRTLPPAPSSPGVGYAEFAGWVPGGKLVLVAREAASEGGHRRSYELVRLDSLATVGGARDPSLLPTFQRWEDPAWRQSTVGLR